MRISVIIPAYNCAKHLEAVIDSIDRSGLNVFEIIPVNDGSTDDTQKVLERLAERDTRIRVIRQENKGVSAARNRGIREAKGDYVYFIDADDALDPGSLAAADGILEDERPDMLLFGMRFDYYYNGNLYRSDAVCYPERGSMDGAKWAAELEKLFRSNMLSPVWNKLIRRDVIISNDISFREDMIEMEDYLFSLRCLACCDRIYLMDRAAYRYRQAENERGTFNRLWRIDSLSRYMTPFYEAAEWFDPRYGAPDKVQRIADQIYSMLFREQLRFASRKQIRIAAEDMLTGAHSEIIARTDPVLYERLRRKRDTGVWLGRAMSRARHWAAVQVKYRRSLRKTR